MVDKQARGMNMDEIHSKSGDGIPKAASLAVSPSLEEIHLLDRQDMQRRRHNRSTRGKNDYRNARMTRERDSMRSQTEREQEREAQKVDEALRKIIGTTVRASVGTQVASPREEVIALQSSKISNSPSFSVQTQARLNRENQTYKSVMKLPPSGPLSKIDKSSTRQAKGKMNTDELKNLHISDMDKEPDKPEPGRVKEDLISPPRGLNPLLTPKNIASIKFKLPREKDIGVPGPRAKTAVSTKHAEKERLQPNANGVDASKTVETKTFDSNKDRQGQKQMQQAGKTGRGNLPENGKKDLPPPTFVSTAGDQHRIRASSSMSPRSSRSGQARGQRNIHFQSVHITTPTCSNPSRQQYSPQSKRHPTMSGQLRGPWTQWEGVVVKLWGLPSNTALTTREIYENLWRLEVESNVSLIEIFDKDREPRARVIFRPPPHRQFWDVPFRFTFSNGLDSQVTARIDLVRAQHPLTSFQEKQATPREMELDIQQLDFGVLDTPKSMKILKSVGFHKGNWVALTMDTSRRLVDIQFKAFPMLVKDIRYGHEGRKLLANRHYRFQIRFSQLSKFIQVNTQDGSLSLVIPLESPPEFYKKIYDMKIAHVQGSRLWKEWDAWPRIIDIEDADPTAFRRRPANLRKTAPLINIGRWTVFRVILSSTQRNPTNYTKFKNMLRDHNIPIISDLDFKFNDDREPAVWQWIDQSQNAPEDQPSTSHLHDLDRSTHVGMPSEVRYLLEVCISQGKLNEYNLSKEFIDRLLVMDELRAIDLLDHVANQRDRIFEPMKIFNMIVTRGPSSRTRIPSYCCMIKSARVTPTTIYYSPASVEVSNRVIRRYKEYSDRFLRVKFTDETHIGQIYSSSGHTKNQLFDRVWYTLLHGIQIGDRKYEFLAFGNSQIREQGAYFFAPLEHLDTSHIRAWMGEFGHIDVIAKYSARLGQCFSTTWAVTCPKVNFRKIEDVEREAPDGKNWCFTDGVGKISRFLARLTTSELRGLRHVAEPPSVYQFRLGGCKGILAVDPKLANNEIHIRPSQDKFPAVAKGLEIISWSQYAPAHLNRQIILVLSSLGVSDGVFMRKLLENLASLSQALTDSTVSCRELQRIVDPNHVTLSLASMVIDGFQDSREPFVTSLLQLWRAWRVKYIKEKANISIPQSALLYGCVDETATLKGHFDELQSGPGQTAEEKLNRLPEIFVQVSSPEEKGKYRLIEGVCLLARNPSLHPGDIRVVRAVNNPNLYHLKDVVVFPQTGDRDLAGMCSGGDLDGDDFLVIWDPELTPTEWNHPPMDYTPPMPLRAIGDVTISDVMAFFVNYMKNNRLGTIAHAHVAWADQLDEGVKSKKCIDLAALHSKAVDYNKTGVEAEMSRDQHPLKWPHFMEKKKAPHQIYHSDKVLGQLFDQVHRIDFVPNYSEPFDERILKVLTPPVEMLSFARELKVEYDISMQQIMAQFNVKTEFEIWTTFLLGWTWGASDYKMHEATGRLSTSLKDRYRQACYDFVGGRDFTKVAPLAVAMYQVTHEEMQNALRECEQARTVDGKLIPVRKMEVASMPLMSFPWVLQKELGKICAGELEGHTNRGGSESTRDRSISGLEYDIEALKIGHSLGRGRAINRDMIDPTLEGLGVAFKDNSGQCVAVGGVKAQDREGSGSTFESLIDLDSDKDVGGESTAYDPFRSALHGQKNDPDYGEFAQLLADATWGPSGETNKSHSLHSSRESASLIDISNGDHLSGDSWVDVTRKPSASDTRKAKDYHKVPHDKLLQQMGLQTNVASLPLPSVEERSTRFNTSIWADTPQANSSPEGEEEDIEEEEIIFEDDGPNPLDLLDRMHAEDI